MRNFTFHNPTKIIFGKGTEKQVGNEVKSYRKILLHYGGGSIKRSGLYDRVVKSLAQAGVAWVELGGVQPNPLLSLVYEGIQLCREQQVNFILAVGGGSVIDSAKAIAVGVPYPGDVWDFFEDEDLKIQAALPVGTILTISAAGSEASDSAVITKAEGQLKRAIGSDLLYPKFSILNPELTATLPRYQIACGIADMMAHIMERYFTRVQHVDLTDRLCEATLQTIIACGPWAVNRPDDYVAQAEIMWAGTIAHNNLLGTGREGDWGSHMIEHELSGIYDVAHGAGLAVVFPAWMKYVYKVDLQRFVQFAVRVWGVVENQANPELTALAGIQRMKDFFASLGLPVRLPQLNIPPDRFEEMAEKATRKGPIGNFKKLDRQDIVNILNLALT